jgi:HSP20 family protein
MLAWRKEERDTDKDTREWRNHRKELSYGKVKRRFRLPENIDVKKITSTFDNGVLHLNIPKKSIKQNLDVKKIDIN